MHIISMRDFRGINSLEATVARAESMRDWARRNTCEIQFPHHKAVLLFLEPSTRTMYSTEQAVLNFGMRHTLIAGTDHISILKGESFADTFRMLVGQGARVIALRTKVEGAPLFAAKICQQYIDEISIINPGPVNIINCGDGRQFHPTQTALDTTTIQWTLGRLDRFTLGIVGDLENGRTCHSLLEAFRDRPGMKFVLVAPKGLEMPKQYTHGLQNYTESESLDALADCDIVYDTRFQLERHSPEVRRYVESIRHLYIINQQVLDSWNQNVRVMHPLPRVDEIAPEISLDKRIIAFQQAEFGITARMALLFRLLTQPFERIDLTAYRQVAELAPKDTPQPIDSQKPVKYFQPIERGTVIDHVPAGQTNLILKMFSTFGCLDGNSPHQIVQYVKSSRYPDNKKDVLLLNNFDLPSLVAATIQAVFPQVTINRLPGDGTIVKRRYPVPFCLTENVHCSNDACITNVDHEAKPIFIFNGTPTTGHRIQCEYCGSSLWN